MSQPRWNRLPHGERRQQFSLNLPRDLIEALDVIAQADERSRSFTIERILRKHIADRANANP